MFQARQYTDLFLQHAGKPFLPDHSLIDPSTTLRHPLLLESASRDIRCRSYQEEQGTLIHCERSRAATGPKPLPRAFYPRRRRCPACRRLPATSLRRSVALLASLEMRADQATPSW